MKKLIFIIFVFGLMFNQMRSQGSKGLYGYGLLGYKYGSTYTYIPESDYQDGYYRLGGGTSMTAGLGWMFHPNFGIEVSTAYLLGNKKSYLGEARTFRSHNLYSVGSVIAQAPLGKCFIYVKAGILVNYMNQTIYRQQQGKQVAAYKIHSAMASGFNGSLGAIIPLSPKINLMVEAEEISLQNKVEHADLLYSDLLIPPAARIQYLENIQNTVSNNTTQYQRSFPIAYSAIGFNLGLQFRL